MSLKKHVWWLFFCSSKIILVPLNEISLFQSREPLARHAKTRTANKLGNILLLYLINLREKPDGEVRAVLIRPPDSSKLVWKCNMSSHNV